MARKIRAIYQHGTLHPLEPIPLSENECVTVTVEPDVSPSADDILQLASNVYKGLHDRDIAEVENIALDRRRFFRENP